MPFPYGGLLAQAIAQEEARQRGLLGTSLGALASTPPQQKGILQSALEQGLPMEGRASLLPFQDTLPGSVMNERQWALPGLLAGAWNAFTAPERARTGNLDPMNVEEAMNVAGMAMGGGLLSRQAAPTGRGILGANVYHGSPHKFDAFDASKIGTGEGAQAYGHGLYLAEQPSVARNYMPKATVVYNSPAHGGKNVVMVGNDVISIHSTADAARKSLGKVKAGNLYKVDLPDEMIPKMLDWDKPLSQQPRAREILEKIHGKPIVGADSPSGPSLGQAYFGISGNLNKTGKNGMEVLSAAFREAGIPGIRYLDQGSRAGGKGTYNYVVFPGEEKALKILERQ